MIKGPTQQDNIVFINIYAPNTRAPKRTQQILTVLKSHLKRKLLTQRKQFFLLMYVQILKQTDYYQHTEWLLFEKHQEWMDIPIKKINICMKIPCHIRTYLKPRDTTPRSVMEAFMSLLGKQTFCPLEKIRKN